jgi:hypothetical protein
MVGKLPIRVRMKPVIEALKEGDKTFSELLRLDVPEKTLARILKDHLEYWGLAYKEGRKWIWYDKKRIFQSRHDYDVAVEHSKNLITSIKKNDLLLALDLLVYSDQRPRNFTEQSFFKHMKTGYPGTYSLMQSYRQIMNKMGFSEESHFPKLHGYGFDATLSKKQEREEMKRLYGLRALLIGKIEEILFAAKPPNLLEGYCDQCPYLKISIKDFF